MEAAEDKDGIYPHTHVNGGIRKGGGGAVEGKGIRADGLKLHLGCCFEFVWAGGWPRRE